MVTIELAGSLRLWTSDSFGFPPAAASAGGRMRSASIARGASPAGRGWDPGGNPLADSWAMLVIQWEIWIAKFDLTVRTPLKLTLQDQFG